ncbi:MAG: cysteine-rich CWC family protein [Pseudomonadales bacterium]|nr:cysteine-rich CWC family protein [Pseudomonadales bacterium]
MFKKDENEKSPKAVDVLLCPLCGENNACVNVSCGDTEKTCWCKNPEISFPASLLDKIGKDATGKACICQACAIAHQISIA